MKNKFKVGIAGYGVVGKRRRFYIDRHPSLKTVAVCDQTFEGNGMMLENVRCYHDYREMLKEDLDILFVSVPNYLAPEVTIAGLEQGLHVFCEKPPGRTPQDVEQVIEIEKKYPDLILKYGFNHRYHDSVKEALRIIQSGQMGEIINLRGVYGKSKIVPFVGQWRAERKYAGGGILLDQGIHMVDLMRLFCGDFTEVKSFVSNQYWNLDVEDNAYALMKSERGGIAILHSSATQWQHQFSLLITLTEGYLELRGILSGSKSYGQEELLMGRRNESVTGTQQEEKITYLEDDSWQDEIQEFADAILRREPVKFGTSKDALEVMKLVYRIYWSDSKWQKMFDIPYPDPVKTERNSNE